MPRNYRVHGLAVRSDIDLPELAVEGDSVLPDLRIEKRTVPWRNSETWRRTSEGFFVSADQTIYLEVDRVARFSISSGTTVLVEPHVSSTEEQVRLFLLGSALGAVLHQRWRVPLHASSVSRGGEAVAFAAESGTGKSTLAAALASRGYQLLGDDVAAVEIGDGGGPILFPGIQRIRLTEESLAAIPDLSEDSRWKSIDDDKIALKVGVRRVRKAARLRRIYFLERAPGRAASIEAIGRLEVFDALRRNIYRRSLIGGLKREADFLPWATRVLSEVECYLFHLSESLTELCELVTLLERHMESFEA